MAYGKRSPLPKLKNTNAIDDVKSALKNKDIKITGAMGSELRAKQYEEKGWAMDNTIGSAQGGTYKKPTAPTGKPRTGSEIAGDVIGDFFSSDSYKDIVNPKPSTLGPVGGGTKPPTSKRPTATSLEVKPQSIQSIADSGNMVSAADKLASKLVGYGANTGSTADAGTSIEAPKKPRHSSDKTANRNYQKALSTYKRKTAKKKEKPTTVAEPTNQKYSTEGKSGKQLRRTNRANRYNTLAKKAFDAGNHQEANRLIREEAGVSKKIDRTKKRRDEKREKRLAKAQAKVKKYTK